MTEEDILKFIFIGKGKVEEPDDKLKREETVKEDNEEEKKD